MATAKTPQDEITTAPLAPERLLGMATDPAALTDRAAVARVIEQAARLAQDARKLTLHVDRLRDLLIVP